MECKLINADDLLSLYNMSAIYEAGEFGLGCIEIINDIKNTPAVDAEPVRHGKWIEIDPRKDVEGWIEYDYQCSICKEISWEGTNYCPNCGARMDGE